MRKRQSEERFRGAGSGNGRTASERAAAIFSNRRAKSVCVALLGSAFVVGGGLAASFDASSVRADEPTVAANVSATTPDAFEYQIEEGFVTITGLREEFREATTVSVPKQIGMGTVKKIAPNAFQKRERLETVVFADATALDEIGARAFAGCSALKSVDFGKGAVGVVGDWAFSQCSALTAVELPKSVRVIGMGAFALCSSLATVSGGDGVEEIAPAAFGGCAALETVVVGPNVQKIGDGAFRGCKRLQKFELSSSGNAAFKTVDGFLTSADGKTLVACPSGRGGEVVVPEGVVEIGAGAFMMGALESVVLPQTLKKIDANAFYSCDALKSVVGAPKALETIGVEAFADCDALERFDWPENLQTIEKQAFRGCGALTTANVKSVRTIGANAFYRCAKLETLELPSATREIGAFAFAETGLKTFKAPRDLAVWNPSTTERSPVEKIEVEEGNAAFQIVDGALLSSDGKTLYYRPQNASETSWKIPNGVRVVAEGALSGAASLTSLEIPEGVETVGAGALRGCSALKKIAIPASLRQIDETFDGCSALTAFEVPEGNEIFSVVDGSLLSKDGKTLYRMARNTEADAAPTEKFVVRGGYGPFATRVVPKGVERIAKGAFGDDRRAQTVKIPATVKQIDAGAFGNCPNLRSISVPASVEQLDERFDSCSWLATFEVDPANPTYKSVDGALLSKDGKTLYRLVVRSEDYRQNATREEGDSRKKYRYVVPEGVETIKKGAFAGAYRMSEIVFPQSLRKIESWAFNGSPLITSVVIPAGVQTIEVGAFGGCDLSEVVLASKSAKFGKTSFLAGDFEAGKLTIRVDDKTLERKVENIEAKMVAEIAEKAASKASEGKSAANEPTAVATLAPTPEAAFEYVKEPTGATITGVREAGRTATTLYIPKELGGSPVRKIAPNAFAGLDRLETLRVDAFIAEMGERAFADCVALKTVQFKEAVVGPEAFAGCASLETFDVAGVYRIEAGAFAGCRNLAAFENSAPQNNRWKIVDGLLLSKDEQTLIACPGGAKGIIIPDGVVAIGRGAFAGGAIETVALPRSLETVGERAFANCVALNSVYSPSGPPKAALATIGPEAFASCVALERFDWPENLRTVEKGAFQNCKSLESAALESVRKIGERAFSGCSKLATLKLPSETREIGAFAFAETALTSFRLPRDLETLTAWALDGLALESVAVEEGNETFKIVDGAVLSADGKTLYYRPAKAPGTSWKIPEGVRIVVRGALANNESLVSVEIPEGVETIGQGAFFRCFALKKLAIPASVRRIDDRFERCFALETFEVAEGNPAYRSVDGALLSKDGKTLYRIAREGGAGLPEPGLSRGGAVKRVIPEGVERIAAGAIGDDFLMTSVEIPETVKRIDAGAFGVCDRLSSLVIPASVERLDERFEGCDALETFRVAPGNRNYTNVGGALLSNDFKTFYRLVGKGVWTRPSALAPNFVYEYRVPALVQTIKQNAFVGASQMEKVVLPQGLRMIERSAFSGATSLTSVTIPASVEKIEKGAFVGAPLREVVLESSSATFDKSAFTTEPAKLTIRVADETLEREKADAEAKKAAEEAKKAAEKVAQEAFQWEVGAGGRATITGVRDKTATSLNIPETLGGAPVTDIGRGACSDLLQLKTVRIGANVERIDGAFDNCVNLESVEFPPASDGSGESKLHAILNGGFEGCSSLKKFAAPVSLVIVGPRSFSGCSALERVELSPRTREIGQGAFRNCSTLREIIIPENESEFLFIGDSAFNGCDALTSFDAPLQLSGLAPNAFGELDRPFQFKLHPDTQRLRDLDGMILSRDGKTICAYFGPKTGELVIPEGVERVGQVFGSISKGADFETIRFPKSLRFIGLQAFMESKSLKRVVLPEDSALESIGMSAFRGCEALESFDWPKTLKTIGNSAFSRCRLKEFVGGEALEKIDAYAFSDCESLTKIELPSGLREIGNGAFSDCGATSIKIPASVQSVGETAFTSGALEKIEVEEGNEAIKVVDGALLSKDGKTLRRVPSALKLKSYKIPDGVEIIERAALGGNVTLETVEIPATVKTIGPDAFYRCVALKKLSIPASVEQMSGAFNRCDGLEQFEVDPKNAVYKSENGALLSADGKTFYRIFVVERDAEAEAKAAAEIAATKGVDAQTSKPIYKNPVYRVPDGVEKIASSAFSDSVGLRNAFTEIVLPESVKEIGGYAFARCARLEKAFIPKNVAKIGEGVFKHCDALKTVEISPENPNYRIENGFLLSKDGKTFYEVTRASGETVLRIPDGVEGIAKTWTWSAFESGPTYTEVVLPETLTSLGEGAFNNWKNLTSITIPKSVKRIGARAFCNCPALAEVVLRSQDTTLDAETFYNYPEGPKPKIRVEAAEPAKASVAEEPETLKTSALRENGAPVAVDSPETFEWRAFPGGEVAILGVRDKTAKSVVVPETLGGIPVKRIGGNAFAGMRELKTVRLPRNLERIDARAFANCVKLEKIEFAKDENGAVASNLQSVEIQAFLECVALKSFEAPDSLVALAQEAFAGCSALETATLGKGLETLRMGAFRDCVALKRVDCSRCEKLTQIGANAFGGCDALSTFDAPKSLRVVEGTAFGGRTMPFAFNVRPESAFLKTVDGCVVTKVDKRLIAYCGERSGVLVVPEGVEEIGANAFAGAAFETVRLPKSLRDVDKFAFAGCESLKRVEIPEDSALVNVGESSFAYCKALETFDWPKSLKQIGGSAFSGCASLKSLTGATSLETIGDSAFSDCKALATVELPNGLREIGACAFLNDEFASIKIPASVKVLGPAGVACTGLEKIEVEEGNEILKVVDGALLSKDGKRLHRLPPALKTKSYKIPDGVEIVGRSALGGNVTLETVELPASATTLERDAFYRCVSLKAIAIPAKIEQIDKTAFALCDNLERFEIDPNNAVYKSENGALLSKDGKMFYGVVAVERDPSAEPFVVEPKKEGEEPRSVAAYKSPIYRVPNGVTTINNGAFDDPRRARNAFTEIVLPESLVVVGSNAFNSCERLETIRVPASVTHLGAWVTSGSAYTAPFPQLVWAKNLALKTFEVAPENKTYRSEDGMLLSADGKICYAVFANKERSVLKVPDGVVRIASGAFDATTATEIVLPESLEFIPNSVFMDCENLTSITIPKNVKQIYPQAFYNCPRLAEVVLKSSDTLYFSNSFEKVAPNLTIRVDENVPTATDGASENVFERSKMNDGTVAVRGVKDKRATELNIPETLDGLRVSQINFNAFAGMRDLRTVRIPSGLETIADGAFENCVKLEKIEFARNQNGEIASALTHIDANAFRGCSSLKSFEAPDSLRRVGLGAFERCASLETVALGQNVENVGFRAFADCPSLRRVDLSEVKNFQFLTKTAFDAASPELEFAFPTDNPRLTADGFLLSGDGKTVEGYLGKAKKELAIPEGVERVAKGLWPKWTKDVETLRLPKSLRAIDDGLFYRCESLKNVVIPEDSRLETIGGNAFTDCYALERFDWPKSLKSIGAAAFRRCRSLKSFTGATSVHTIAGWAFCDCESLTEVELPSGLVEIGPSAFAECGFTSIEIPASVRVMGDAALAVTPLKTIEVEAGNEALKIVDGALLSKDGKTLFRLPPALKLKEFKIPNGVEIIERAALGGNETLESVEIPASVTTIKTNAFYRNSSLKEIFIPAAVRMLADAFPLCDALERFEVDPNNLVYKSENGALLSKDGKTLYRIVAVERDPSAAPITLEGDENLSKLTKRDETSRSIPAYKSDVYVVPDGVATLADGAFSDVRRTRNAFTEIVLPQSLEKIGERAFEYCSRLETLRIPASVREIGDYSFSGFRALKTFEIDPKNVVYRVQDGMLLSADGKMFYGVVVDCERRVLKLPEGVKYATWKTGAPKNFEELVLPESLFAIQSDAFAYCMNLTKVAIPKNVQTIQSLAFSNSPKLEEVVLKSKSTQYIFNAFQGVAPNCAIRVVEDASAEKIEATPSSNDDATSQNSADAKWQDVDGVMLSEDGKTLYVYPAAKKEKEYQVPDGVETIAVGAFSRNLFIEKVKFPWTLKKIEAEAFSGCKNLAEIRFFPVVNLLESIGERAFYGCDSLVSINLPDGIRRIEQNAFASNALETVEFYPVDVETKPGMTIAEAAFVAPNLKSFEVPETICSFANRAVSSGALENFGVKRAADESARLVVTLPPNPVGIEPGAFAAMANLVEIKADPACRLFKTVDGALLSADGKTFYFYPKTNRAAEFDVPDGVERIVSGAFVDARVRKIRTPKTLKQVDAKAFGGSYLETLEFGEGARVVNPDAVGFCGGLTTLKLPSTLQNADRVVKGCALRLRKLANVEIASENPALKTVDGLTLSVDGKTLYFCSQEKGSGEVVVPDGVETIANWAFAGRSLEAIRFPKTLQRIEECAFAFCENLKSASLPDGLEVVGERAFQACGALSSISLPASVVAVERSAFASCAALKSIDVAAENPAYRNVDGVLLSKDGKTICAYPCGKDATEYVAPDGVEATAIFAFHGAKKLAKVVFPQGFKSQGYQAFCGCRSDLEVVEP